MRYIMFFLVINSLVVKAQKELAGLYTLSGDLYGILPDIINIKHDKTFSYYQFCHKGYHIAAFGSYQIKYREVIFSFDSILIDTSFHKEPFIVTDTVSLPKRFSYFNNKDWMNINEEKYVNCGKSSSCKEDRWIGCKKKGNYIPDNNGKIFLKRKIQIVTIEKLILSKNNLRFSKSSLNWWDYSNFNKLE